MYDWDLQVVLDPPKADLKRRILEEWLRNPFLDDDAADLCLRLGAGQRAVGEALDGLCATGFLRRAGAGYALGLDLGGTLPGTIPVPSAGANAGPAPAGPAPAGSDTAPAADELASLSGAIATDSDAVVEAGEQTLLALLDVDRADDLTCQIEKTLAELQPGGVQDAPGELIEALPFGLISFTPAGRRELANRRAADMLGLAPAQLDAATFEFITGVDPLVVLDHGSPLSFSLTEPCLEVTLQSRRLPGGNVILALLRDVSLLEEVSRIQAEAQEALFAGLRTDMVEPLAQIERFLEAPDAAGLTAARVAMEQINWFLQEFLLRRLQPGGDGNPDDG